MARGHVSKTHNGIQSGQSDQVDPLAVALAKLKDPPQPSMLIGQVVSKDMPSTSLSSQPSAEKHSSQEPISQTSSVRSNLTVSTIKPRVIAPTAPEADAPIARAKAEREAALKSVTEPPKHLEVTPAQFVTVKFDTRSFFIWGIIWACAIPFGVLLYMVTGHIATGSVIDKIVTVIEYLLGIYGLLGWMPLVLKYIRTQKGQ